MKTTTTINSSWNAYDKMTAQCHLANYGVIFLDNYDLPIDDEYLLEELYDEVLNNEK